MRYVDINITGKTVSELWPHIQLADVLGESVDTIAIHVFVVRFVKDDKCSNGTLGFFIFDEFQEVDGMPVTQVDLLNLLKKEHIWHIIDSCSDSTEYHPCSCVVKSSWLHVLTSSNNTTVCRHCTDPIAYIEKKPIGVEVNGCQEHQTQYARYKKRNLN